MKFFKTLIMVLVLFLTTSVYGAHQLYADADSVTIPYGTKLELYLSHDLTTKNVVQGDIFQSYLVKDIYVNNKLILPAMTSFRGRVSKVKYSKILSRPASLYLTLDHLVTKTGAQLPISAGISSDFEYVLKTDGALTTDGNYFKSVARDARNSKQYVTKSINWGKSKGGNIQYVLVPLGAVGGGIACVSSSIFNTFADLFKHGDEIIIKKGTKFNILLLSDLDVPS